MIFLSALLSFVLNASGIVVATCETDWLDPQRFEEVLSAEVATLSEAERRDMVLTINACTDVSVSLHVTDRAGTRERTISIAGVPKEARMRTVAIALGEPAKESSIENTTAVPENLTVSTSVEANTAPVEIQSPLMNAPVEKSPPKSDEADLEKQQCLPEETVDAGHRDRPKLAAEAYFRAFPLAKTLAPELRLGLRWDRWRADFGGYAMGWSEALGTVYLTAFTFTVGRTLWQHRAAVAISFDALAELGIVVAFGKTTTETVNETPKINMLAGAHLGWTVGPGRTEQFFPSFNLEVGWVRGLNAYAGDAFVGGFEGVSAAAGFQASW